MWQFIVIQGLKPVAIYGVLIMKQNIYTAIEITEPGVK